MKNMYKKGQAATEFLMTYGWAILAIVIVAAVLWNMGIFKSSCTQTAAVQVFPSGSQLGAADWGVDINGNMNLSISNLAGSDVTINSGTYKIGVSTATFVTPVTISAGTKGLLNSTGGNAAGTLGNCFNGGTVSLSYSVSGGVPHTITGTVQGKY